METMVSYLGLVRGEHLTSNGVRCSPSHHFSKFIKPMQQWPFQRCLALYQAVHLSQQEAIGI